MRAKLAYCLWQLPGKHRGGGVYSMDYRSRNYSPEDLARMCVCGWVGVRMGVLVLNVCEREREGERNEH